MKLKKSLKKIIRRNNKSPSKKKISYVISDTTVIHECSRIYNKIDIPENITIGAHTHVLGEIYTFPSGGKVTIGDFCYIGENSRIWSYKSIRIGMRVLIAHDVNIFDSRTHPVDPIERHNHYRKIILEGHPVIIDNLNEKEIIIKDDAWIGAKSIIHSGCIIGERAIVSAGSVVINDVPPDVIVGGNPAKIIKRINN